jgi:anaerobic selenocysteine-containing dehydrogenase
MPQLPRIRRILAQDRLFLVVQDLFLTETAELADVVLPAATWGEKRGTFTCVDRTVHLSEKAVDPPGQARADLDIFLDFARRMDFRNDDGEPLIGWTDAESAFEAWKACTRGRRNDYTGITYDKLRGSGIQWPCNDDAPDGTERLYTDATFWTDPDRAETYGHDLRTGAATSRTELAAARPDGRAILKGAHHRPAPEEPSDAFPLLLTTGRTVYQFHTRTKTDRAPQLHAAAPEVWVELNAGDAAAADIVEGDLVRLESPRGTSIEAQVRISGIRPGMAFVPFHYGYWDDADGERQDHGRAANELTVTAWDPVSKQPVFKVAAVRLVRLAGAGGTVAPAPTTGGAAPVDPTSVPPTTGGPAAEVLERVGVD